MRTLLRCLALATAAGAVPAAVSDLRVGYERYGDPYRIQVDAPGVHTSDDRHWDNDNGGFIEFGARLPFVRIGLDAFFRRREDSTSVADVTYDSYGGRLTAGLSLPIVPKLLHLELMPYVALGQGRLRFATAVDDEDDRATFTEYGAHLDVVVTAVHVQGGLGVGFAASDTTFHERLLGANADVAVRERVPLLRGFVGISF